MNSVLLLGANGQLGSSLANYFRSQKLTVSTLTREDIDLSQQDILSDLETLVAKSDVIINAAAYTNTKNADFEIELAYQLNAFVPHLLAKLCRQFNKLLIHFSTDYVFSGEKSEPLTEDDPTFPINVYGASKLSGEHLIQAYCDNHYIFRVSSLYGNHAKNSNFPKTMLNMAQTNSHLKVVNDQFMSPTYTEDVAWACCEIINKNAPFGLYHLTNTGNCSWHEFTKELMRLATIDIDIKPVSMTEFPSPIKRPSYSVLSNNKIKPYIQMPHWKDALVRFLEKESKL